jgi:hypothetical protein
MDTQAIENLRASLKYAKEHLNGTEMTVEQGMLVEMKILHDRIKVLFDAVCLCWECGAYLQLDMSCIPMDKHCEHCNPRKVFNTYDEWENSKRAKQQNGEVDVDCSVLFV